MKKVKQHTHEDVNTAILAFKDGSRIIQTDCLTCICLCRVEVKGAKISDVMKRKDWNYFSVALISYSLLYEKHLLILPKPFCHLIPMLEFRILSAFYFFHFC